MASLWRVLALSWLGGVASPILMNDAAIADELARPVAATIQQGGEQPGIKDPNAVISGHEETSSPADTGD
jgi:hypothetical protein